MICTARGSGEESAHLLGDPFHAPDRDDGERHAGSLAPSGGPCGGAADRTLLGSPDVGDRRTGLLGLLLAGLSAAAFGTAGVFAAGLLDAGWSAGSAVGKASGQ